MSDTPRTDAEVFDAQQGCGGNAPNLRCVPVEFARQLERALRQIAELTERQQLPITSQIHDIAVKALQ